MRLCMCVCVCVGVCCNCRLPFLLFPVQCACCVAHTIPAGTPGLQVDAEEAGGGKGSSAHVHYFIHTTQATGKQQLSRSVHQFVSFAPIAIYTYVCRCVRVCVKVRSHTHMSIWTCCAHTQMPMMSMRARQQNNKHPRQPTWRNHWFP